MEKIMNLLKQINIKAYIMIIALLAIWITFSIADPTYFSARNFSNLIRQTAVTGVLAIGMVYVIIAGEIDLSVGSLLGLFGGLAAYFDVTLGLPIYLNIISVIIIGAMVGIFNGYFIAYAKIPSFIVTLAGMLGFRGVLLAITQGNSINNLSPGFSIISSSYLTDYLGYTLSVILIVLLVAFSMYNRKSRVAYKLPVTNIYSMVGLWLLMLVAVLLFTFYLSQYNGIPTPVLILIVLAILFSYMGKNTVFGRRIYAIGGNMEASRLSGVPVERTKLFVFMNMGILVAVAGFILTSRVGSATPSAGSGAELDAIAACFIGGTSMRGGVGTVFGAILGALIMESLKNGMSLMDVQYFWQEIIKGIVLLLAIWFDSKISKNRA